MIVLCCGGREWEDRVLVRLRLARLPAGAVVLHGACRGADTICGEEAARRGLEVRAQPADWVRYGKSAGPIRNRAMLDCRPDLVIAFHDDLVRSIGTKDCVEEARRRGIAVEVVGHEFDVEEDGEAGISPLMRVMGLRPEDVPF